MHRKAHIGFCDQKREMALGRISASGHGVVDAPDMRGSKTKAESM